MTQHLQGKEIIRHTLNRFTGEQHETNPCPERKYAESFMHANKELNFYCKYLNSTAYNKIVATAEQHH